MTRKLYGSIRPSQPDPFDHISPRKRLVLVLVLGIGPWLLLLSALGPNDWLGLDSGDAQRSEEIYRQTEACKVSRDRGGPGC